MSLTRYQSRRLEADWRRYDLGHLNQAVRPQGVPLSEDQALVRKQTLHQVTSEPGTLDMCNWDTGALQEEDPEYQPPACGTARCLAGWALFFAGSPVRPHEPGHSVEALGLTRAEYLSAGAPLFFTHNSQAAAVLRRLVERPA